MSRYAFTHDKIESCKGCPLIVERNYFDGNEWHCCCRISGKEVSDNGEKAEDCPLTELFTEEEQEYMDYQRACEERDYCERYEPTYNPEDGSL